MSSQDCPLATEAFQRPTLTLRTSDQPDHERDRLLHEIHLLFSQQSTEDLAIVARVLRSHTTGAFKADVLRIITLLYDLGDHAFVLGLERELRLLVRPSEPSDPPTAPNRRRTA